MHNFHAHQNLLETNNHCHKTILIIRVASKNTLEKLFFKQLFCASCISRKTSINKWSCTFNIAPDKID